jgi:Arc/MetJ-type ribon-helix-helix transcriptional regulator
MTITLTPEHERIVQTEIASGRFRSPEEVVGKALALLHLKDTETAAATNLSGGQRARAFEQWAVRRAGPSESCTNKAMNCALLRRMSQSSGTCARGPEMSTAWA